MKNVKFAAILATILSSAKDKAGDSKPLSMMPVTFQTTSLTAGKSR